MGKVFEILPGARIPASLTPGTIPYINYQYSPGRKNQYGEYGNWFFSGGAKYEFTRRFVLQVSAAQSILLTDDADFADRTVAAVEAAVLVLLQQ